MLTPLFLSLGAILGAFLRYGFHVALNHLTPLFLGTLLSNILGGFLVGASFAFVESVSIPYSVKTGIQIGFLGSLTTFSAFSLETFFFLKKKAFGLALLHLALHILGSLLFLFLGFMITKKLLTSR